MKHPFDIAKEHVRSCILRGLTPDDVLAGLSVDLGVVPSWEMVEPIIMLAEVMIRAGHSPRALVAGDVITEF